MNFTVRKQLAFLSLALGLGVMLASPVRAATTFWSPTAPTVDGADIANFTGVSADADNILGGDDAGTYIAANRPAQGQTFTTGSDAGGYTLNAITLQHVNYETYWSLDTGWTGYNGGRFQIQIGTIAAGVFTPIATEDAYMDASAPANQNPGTGSAQYVSLTLDTPVSLSANSTYAFAVTTTADSNLSDGPYFELNGDGTTSANYPGGEAFSLTGTPGGGDQTGDVVNLTGDRVFHLDLAVGLLPIQIVSRVPADGATDVNPQPIVEAIITDGSSAVDTNSIELTFDNADVTGSSTISQNAGTTTVTYVPATLASESVHTAQVVVADMPLTTTLTSRWSFTVLSYTTLPTNWAHSPGGTNGMWYRDVHHPDTGLENSEARAIAQLALKLPYPNHSDYAFASGTIGPYQYFLIPEDTYADNETINLNIPENLGVNPAGNFSEFKAPPYDNSEGEFLGVADGINIEFANSTDFATETYGFLELSNGFYTIGVNSDDGFVFYMGEQPLSLFAPAMGRFDGSRAAADTLFGVEVQQAGLYPFRLVHYQGDGGGSLELFTVDPDGTKKLVNDATYGGVPAYRLAEGPPYVSWVEPQEGTIVTATNHDVTIEITDGQGSTLSSYQLLLGGSNVTASTTAGTKVDGVTPITYTGGLPYNTTNAFTIILSDGVGISSNDFEVIIGDKPSHLRVPLIDPMTRNGSFELLGGVTSSAKAIDWDFDPNGDVDNWTQLAGPTGDSGTEAYPGRQTDGDRYAFLQPSNEVFNLTDTVAAEGDIFEFSFDQTSSAPGMQYAAYLIYDSTGSGTAAGIVKITESRVGGTTAGTAVGTTYIIPPGSPAIGKKIGVALVSEGDYPFIDNVVLTEIVKPVIVAASFNGPDFEVTATKLLPGVEYFLLRASDLSDGGAFTDVVDVLTATSETEVFSDPNAALTSPRAFYLISE